MRHFIIPFIILFFASLFRANAEVKAEWSTRLAVPGEQVMLYLFCSGDTAKNPRIRVSPLHVQGARVSVSVPQKVDTKANKKGGGISLVIPIFVTPDKDGNLEIGNIDLFLPDGSKVQVKAPTLYVHPTSDVRWYNSPFTYGVLWHCDSKESYADQEVKAMFKLFLPGSPNYVWRAQYAPTFNTNGVDFGEFKPTPEGLMESVHKGFIQTPVAFANGRKWAVQDFTGSFTPTKSGNLNIVGSITMARDSYNGSDQADLVLPPLTISALPLPPKAPANFANLVGSYTVTAKTEATSLAMNEPVEVKITITGDGGLGRVVCPAPETPENWKLSRATKEDTVDANNRVTAVVFTQVMRPTTEVDGVPAFSLCYFDPAKQEYITAATRPIPLEWRKTETAGEGLQSMRIAEPPPAGTVPVAEMTDIYSTYLPSGSGVWHRIPRWVCYLLYLPAIGIFLTMLGVSIHRRVAAGASGRALEKELTTIGQAKDGLSFLKSIGSFIESHIPTAGMTPELQAILQKRDSLAFRPDAKGSAETVGAVERQSMLKQVRQAMAKTGKAAMLLVAAVLAVGTGLQAAGESDADAAAQAAYEAAQYSDCLEKLQPVISGEGTATAEAWYNAGNCHYRLNKPGKAALCYARALQIKPWLPEAKANLAFIQRKEGAILPNRSTTDEIFTFLSAGQLWLATVVCTSMLALCIALQVLRRKQNRPWLHTCTAATALLSLLCAVNQVYYNTREVTDISALPPANLAYVVKAAEARTAADDSATSVVSLPASTPVHLLARRGSWAYVETFTGVRGWVPAQSVENLLPGAAEPVMPVYVRFD